MGGVRPSRRFVQSLPELRYEFLPATVEKARHLGLAPIRVDPGAAGLNITPELFADYFRDFWHPTFIERTRLLGGRHGNLPLPAATPVALK